MRIPGTNHDYLRPQMIADLREYSKADVFQADWRTRLGLIATHLHEADEELRSKTEEASATRC